MTIPPFVRSKCHETAILVSIALAFAAVATASPRESKAGGMRGNGKGEAEGTEQGAPPPFRILFSNDATNITNCPSSFNPDRKPFSEAMLRAAVDEVARAGADAMLLQPGLGWVPWWQSETLPMAAHAAWLRQNGRTPNSFENYVLKGGDMVGVFVDECRKTGMAPLVSLRMNDLHHVYRGAKRAGDEAARENAMAEFQLIADHPEWRLGAGADTDPRMQYAMDFARPEVRGYKLRLLEEISRGYDIDGVELDFMRHWALFHPDRTTSRERARLMTDFLRRVRSLLDAHARPGQHRWLAVRIPGYMALHEAMGIDLPAWTEAGVDIFNVSGHYFTDLQLEVGPIRQAVPLRAGVYAELQFTNAVGPNVEINGKHPIAFRRTTDRQLYTAAHLAYARAATGVSTFNFHYYRGTWDPSDVYGSRAEPPFHTLPHLRDPEWLARQPQQYVVGLIHNALAKSGRPLRPPIAPGAPASVTLDMAPPAGGWKQDGKLRIQARASLNASQWEARLNGTVLEATEDVSDPFPNPYAVAVGEPGDYRAWIVPGELLRDGPNTIDLALIKGAEAQIFYLDVSLPN